MFLVFELNIEFENGFDVSFFRIFTFNNFRFCKMFMFVSVSLVFVIYCFFLFLLIFCGCELM